MQHILSFPKGTILFSAGEPAAAAYVILEGNALATQGPHPVALGPGGFLGAVAFFQEREHSYTALCDTELKALILTKENLREVAARQPGISLALLRELALQVPQTEGLGFIQGRQEERGEQLVPADFLPEFHPFFECSVPVEYC